MLKYELFQLGNYSCERWNIKYCAFTTIQNIYMVVVYEDQSMTWFVLCLCLCFHVHTFKGWGLKKFLKYISLRRKRMTKMCA